MERRRRSKRKQQNRRWRAKRKEEMLDHYGQQCACCGITQPEFLTLDHVNGGGRKHRSSIKKELISWLKERGWPKEGYRILCMNCNLSIGVLGYCPHQEPNRWQQDLRGGNDD